MRSLNRFIAVATLVAVLVNLLAIDAKADQLTIKGQDAAGIFDSKFYESYTHINWGGATTLTIVAGAGTSRVSVFTYTNADTIGVGATVNTATLRLYCEGQTGATVAIVPLWKPFKEGNSSNATQVGASDEHCWHHIDGTSADSTFTGVCASSANDAGPQNRGDGVGYDRMATPLDSKVVNATGWWEWDITTWYQAVYAGDILPYGFALIETSATGSTSFSSSESGTTTQWPEIVVDFTPDAGNPPARRSRLIRNGL